MNKALIRYCSFLYSFLLKFYPQSYQKEFGGEMKYVFSQSLKDANAENGTQGIINLWGRTIIDAARSLIKQHIENIQSLSTIEKGGVAMKTKNTDIIMQDKVFLWLAGGTALLLLIPALLMQFQIALLDPGSGYEVLNWSLMDFVAMGILIFVCGSMFVIAARKIKIQRVVLAVIFLFAFLAVWAELAVDAVSKAFSWIF